jgi:hypothetical protein
MVEATLGPNLFVGKMLKSLEFRRRGNSIKETDGNRSIESVADNL